MDSVAENSDSLISVNSVSFSYSTAPVLVDITLKIETGDFLAIIGPNGSGKTTLVKIILGLLSPNKGHVAIFGRPLSEFIERHKIGYVPQKATHIDPFFPVSVKEVVSMGLLSPKSTGSLKKEDLKIRTALQHVGLENFYNRRIGSLSSGEQQRVFIARAIVSQPHVLFLDEPTTGVDVTTQEHFYDILDDLNKNHGITIVLVTHEVGLINKHVSRVACLNQKLIYHGTHADFCRSDSFRKMLEEGHHIVSHKH